MGNDREVHLRAYIAALTAFAAALGASWVYWYGLDLELTLVVGAIILASIALLGEIFPVRISERTTISTCALALMVAVAALGPTWAALAAIPSALFVGGRDLLRAVYEVSHSVIFVFLAGMVFSLVSKPVLVSGSASLATVFYGTLIAGATLVVTSGLINSLLIRVKYGRPVSQSWAEMMQPYLLTDAVNVLTAGLGILTLVVYGPVAAIVVVAGSIGSHVLVLRSREKVRENRELRTRVGSLEEALATVNSAFGTMIIRDLGKKDGYTHRHAAATAVYAADLAREMKLDEARAGRLRMAGLLHNIGLFGMPDELLLAGEKLNSIALCRLAEHPARGEEALAAIPEFEEMASWVRWHHERPDGRGYPDKLRGPWIPLEAKILAVAQAYAAMVLDKPRRPGKGFAAAREQLTAGIDTEFDGVVVRAFLRILDTESDGYRMADDYRFVFPVPRPSESAGGETPRRVAGDGQTRTPPG